MKLKSVLVFGVVIASLAFVAIAGDVKELDLKFKGEGSFEVVFDEELGAYVYIPPGGFELLNVSHLGLSKVEWKLLYLPPDEPPFGWFTITGANGDRLEGIYDGFVLDLLTGDYDLEWAFTGGTGRFEGASGEGHTDGLANLLAQPPHAVFEFSGTITVPKE